MSRLYFNSSVLFKNLEFIKYKRRNVKISITGERKKSFSILENTCNPTLLLLRLKPNSIRFSSVLRKIKQNSARLTFKTFPRNLFQKFLETKKMRKIMLVRKKDLSLTARVLTENELLKKRICTWN